MLDLGDLVGRIVLDDKFSQPLDQAEGKTSSFGSTAGKIALGVGAAFAAVGAAAAVGVGALVATGVKYNAEMETYRANLTTLLGSADAAKDQLAQLSAFAAATPFEMPSLADASQTLLSFGTQSKDLMPTLKMLGDISLGNSDKMQSLALVFGQVQSTGHLMGQDLLQMINVGFNPLQVISEKTGESMDSLKQKMADGAISFDMVRDAMQSATSEGGQFFNAMQNGAVTFEGQVSTLKDGLNILSGAITGDLSGALSGAALPAINNLVGGLVGLVNGTEGAAGTVKQASGDLATAISTGVGPAIQSLADNLGTVMGAIGPVLVQVAGTLVSSLAAIMPGLVGVAGQIILSLVNGIVAAAPGMVRAAIPAVMSLITGLLQALPALVSAAGQILLALASGITAAIPTLIPVVVQVVTQLVGIIVTLLPQLLQAGLSLLMALGQGIIGALPTLIGMLPDLIVGIVTFILGAVPQILMAGIQLLMALVQALPAIQDALVKALPEIIKGIVGFMVTQGPQITASGVKLFTALVQNMPAIVSAIVQSSGSILPSLIDAFAGSGATGRMAAAGRDMIMGLVNGIGSMGGAIAKAATNMANQAINTIKSVLGIHSPSVVFHGFGVNTGEGFIEGLHGMQPQVDAAMQAMVQVPAMSSQTYIVPAQQSVQQQVPPVTIERLYTVDMDEAARKIREEQTKGLAMAGLTAGAVTGG